MGFPLLEELNRRRVFRALVAYGLAAFAILQIIEPVMHGLHWPDAVLSYAVVALALGFPMVIALAWVFDVKAGRFERTAPAAGTLRGPLLAAVIVGIGVVSATPGMLYYFVARRAPPPPAAGAPSITVLPFVNMSAEKNNEYFSDGITEELISVLANVEGLRVVSRTAVFALKGKSLDVDQIGAQLKVSTLLEGSVRRQGNSLRITAQLINVADGYHLWSQTYDKELKNIFAVEDEIARSIAQALRRTLVRGGGVKPSTASLEAHDLYLKGRFFWNKRTVEAFRTAADYFQQAIVADPLYALAYTGLADAIALRMDYDLVRTNEVAPPARVAALKALEIDPRLAEAHCSLGNILWHEFDWTGAIKEFRTAIELKPDYATAHQWLAETLGAMGRLPEARAEIELALRTDPTSLVINTMAGTLDLFAHDFARAEGQYRKTLELDPSFELAHWWLCEAFVAQGKPEQAAEELAQLHSAPASVALGYRGIIDALEGRKSEALAAARQLEAQSRGSYVQPSVIAGIFVALGDKDRAFPLLMQACEERDGNLLWFKVDPIYDRVRADPRFAEVLKCMNLG